MNFNSLRKTPNSELEKIGADTTLACYERHVLLANCAGHSAKHEGPRSRDGLVDVGEKEHVPAPQQGGATCGQAHHYWVGST